MPTQKKIQIVEKLTSNFARAQSAAFVDYQGLTSLQLEKLRNQVQEKGGNFQIAKNTLLKLALPGQNEPAPLTAGGDFLVGPTAVLFSFDDETTPLRILHKFIQEYELPKIKGGLLQGTLIDAEQILRLAKLPSREELLSRLAGQMQAPLAGLQFVLQANLQDLMSVLRKLSRGGDWKMTKEKEAKKQTKTIDEILEKIEKLTVLELSDLVKALEEKFGVSAVAPVAVSTTGTAPTTEASAATEEKDAYDVVMIEAGVNKINVIKAIRELRSDLGLKETKDLTENLPAKVLEQAKKETANEAKGKLEGAGAKIELK